MVHSADKGKRAERAVVAYLRPLCPASWNVRRAVETGTADRGDPGDVAGIPGVCVQVKDTDSSRSMVDGYLASCLADVRQQRVVSGKRVGLLVQKRQGRADAADWWAWLTVGELTRVTGVSGYLSHVLAMAPVRLRLGDLGPELVAWAEEHERQARAYAEWQVDHPAPGPDQRKE